MLCMGRFGQSFQNSIYIYLLLNNIGKIDLNKNWKIPCGNSDYFNFTVFLPNVMTFFQKKKTS